MQRRDHRFGQHELARVAKRHALHWIEPQTQFVSHGSGHATASPKGNARVTAFSLTDNLLADT